jgi:hypothetical protein
VLSVLVDSKNAGKRIAMTVTCSRIQLILVKSAIRSYITIHGVGFPTDFSVNLPVTLFSEWPSAPSFYMNIFLVRDEAA